MVRSLVVDEEYLRQTQEAHNHLHCLLSSNKDMAPVLLRLAFHDAGTYDKKTNTGGPNGSIRNYDLNQRPNKGLDVAIDFLEPTKKKYPKISYADLYQLAGIVAVQVTGGPVIQFVPGRADVENQSLDQGTVANPNGDAPLLRSIFIDQMGLSDRDIVVLSGSHSIGRAYEKDTGFEGPFTRDPLTFDNSYFIELLKGDTPGLVKFPTDNALLDDKVFRPLVELYAKDKELFFKHYAESHKKFTELGFHPNLHTQAEERHVQAEPPLAKL